MHLEDLLKMQKISFILLLLCVSVLLAPGVLAANVDLTLSELNQIEIEEGKTYQLTLTVTNLETTDVVIDLKDNDASISELSLTYLPDRNNVNIDGSKSQNFVATIRAASNIESTITKTLTFDVEERGTSNKLVTESVTVELTPPRQPKLEFDTPNLVTVEEGSSTVLSVLLRNTGNVKLVNIEPEVTNSNSQIEIDITPKATSLEAGSSTTFSFTVSPVIGAQERDYNVAIKADASDGTTATTSATVKVTKIPVDRRLTFLDKDKNAISQLTFDLLRGDEGEKIIYLRNEGGDVLNVDLLPEISLDDGNNVISLSFTPVSKGIPLSPTSETPVTVKLDVDDGQELRTYSGKLAVEDTSNQFIRREIGFRINVQPDLCNAGIVGDALSIDIENPDSDDEYKVGETVHVEIEARNGDTEDLRTTVEAFLYNGNKKVDRDEKTQRIKDNDDKTFKLDLFVDPEEDIDPDDDLVLYVQAFEKGHQDRQCIQVKEVLDLQIDDRDLLISSSSMSRSGQVELGTLLSFPVTVVNIGDEDEENAFVEIVNSRLGISERSTPFDVEQFGEGDDSEATRVITVAIPNDAKSGTYSFTLNAVLDNGARVHSVFSDEIVVEGIDDGKIAVGAVSGKAVTVLDRNIEAELGDKIRFDVQVENPTETIKSYQIEFEPIGEWALVGFETLTLAPGASDVVTIESSVLQEGSSSGIIKVSSGGNTVDSISINADVEQITDGTTPILGTGGTVYSTTDGDGSGFFDDDVNKLLTAGGGGLGAIIIVLFTLLIRQQKKGYYLPPK